MHNSVFNPHYYCLYFIPIYETLRAEGTHAKTLRGMCAWLLRKVGSDPEDETDWSSLVISDFSLSQNPVEALLK